MSVDTCVKLVLISQDYIYPSPRLLGNFKIEPNRADPLSSLTTDYTQLALPLTRGPQGQHSTRQQKTRTGWPEFKPSFSLKYVQEGAISGGTLCPIGTDSHPKTNRSNLMAGGEACFLRVTE